MGIVLIELLDAKLNKVKNDLLTQDYWQEFTSSSFSNEMVLDTMKWIMREIWTYQIEVNRSVFTAVGRYGDHVSQQSLIRAMIAVQIEEVGHGTVALEDFYKLGGKDYERDHLPSPPSTALIAVVRYLGEHGHPLCHLGFMYFFEKFTTIITELVMPYLIKAGYPNDSLAFMKLHAEEDERHAYMLSEVIDACCKQDPSAQAQILYGFDCFAEVYPHKVWSYALNKSKELTYA